MRKTVFAVGVALAMLQAAGLALAEETAKTHVDATVLCDAASIKRGDSFTLAVVLKPQADWHIYWRNPGDAGLPTEFKLSLPEGCKAEAPGYPLPTQFNQPGNIVAYGYEGAAVFLIRVNTSKELAAQKSAAIKINVSWLSCNSERCVPGGKELALSVPIGGVTVAAAGNEGLFENARKLIPAEAPPATEVTAKSLPPADGSIMLQLEWKNPPTGVEAFPLALDGLEVAAPKIETVHNRTTIAFPAKILAGQKLTSDHLQVLIVYTGAGGQRRGFYTSVALPATASSNAK